MGYTLILVIDKVLFDTHALFDHDHETGDIADPAAKKLQDGVKRSFANAERDAAVAQSPKELRASQQRARDEVQ